MSELTQTTEDISHKHSFFKSKEHYLEFINSWKQYINDGHYVTENLDCIHHLLYNAFRKRDLHKSFAPITNRNKLYSTGPYRAFYYTLSELGSVVRNIGKSWNEKNLERIKKPFGNSVTDEMLKELYESIKDIKL